MVSVSVCTSAGGDGQHLMYAIQSVFIGVQSSIRRAVKISVIREPNAHRSAADFFRFRVFVGPFWPENPKTDWDDKPGLPRVVIPVRFKVFWPFSARKPPNGLGWASQGCYPSPLFGFLAPFGQKNPKPTGMTNLGFPGLSSQSVSGFFGTFRPENPKTDWHDKPGLPTVVIPVRFGFFWPCFARKPRNGLG